MKPHLNFIPNRQENANLDPLMDIITIQPIQCSSEKMNLVDCIANRLTSMDPMGRIITGVITPQQNLYPETFKISLPVVNNINIHRYLL